jgi:DNA repair protein RadC
MKALHYPGLGQFKVTTLRECPAELFERLCDTPEKAAEYWRAHICTADSFDGEVETFWCLALNTRRKIIGCFLVSSGTLDTILVHPISVFRPAVVASAAALVLMHNHPSGDPTPSEADIKVTRDLIKAGQLLKVEVLDHVVMGRQSAERAKGWVSLRELGYFFS